MKQKHFNDIIKTFVAVFCLVTAVSVTSVSCTHEEDFDANETLFPELSNEEAYLSFSVKDPGLAETKSVITAAGFETNINTIAVYIVDPDGHFVKRYFSSGNSGLEKVIVRADGSTYYDIYALVNMGNVNLPVSGGVVYPANFAYTLPDTFSNLDSSGMPMCGYARLEASSIIAGQMVTAQVLLSRLLSKLVVTVNKQPMLIGSSDGSPLLSGRLRVAQVAKVLRPFAAESDRRAKQSSEMYSVDTDWHNFTVSEQSQMANSNVVLYLPENRQGVAHAGAAQKDKEPASDRDGFVTYLEYTASKQGGNDGVAGEMVFRTYLGGNVNDDFNVVRDRIYNATLNLSWDGLWEGAWRVTSSSFSDSRALVISAAANSSDPMITQNTKAGSVKVRKGTPTAFYMNFFPNGTSGSVAHSRKDLSTWPYGWIAYVDGSEVYMSGTSGTIKTPSNEDLISWAYDAASDCLSMETIAGAPASADIHTLQFKTIDGRKESNFVYFTTSIPFEFRWRDEGVPNHVAQRGILEALDADTHAVDDQGIFHVKAGYASKIRLQYADGRTAYKGTVAVELLDPFVSVEDAIYIEDSDGDRHCDVPLEARLPWFECSNLWTTYVDASVNLKFSYYACTDDATPAKSSTRMVVVNPGSVSAIVAGAYLDYALIAEGNRITPSATSSNSKLGFTTTLNSNDGTLNINTYIATYTGLVPSGNYFTVDQASICINGHASERGTHNTTFIAWNPWKNIDKNISGDILDDYTLYCVPNQAIDTPNYGWMTSGTRYSPPTPADNTTLNIQNPVVANEGNITFNTLFDGTDRYLGNICTIDPDKPLYKTSANYDPSTWTLVVDITDPVAYDKQRLYDYLYGRGYSFYDIYDMDMQLQEYNHSFIIGGSYASSSAAWNDTPSGVSESTPSTIQGTTFRVYSNAGRSEWGMIYGMKGVSKDDITTHGAGKINMLMRIHNTHDDSYLEWKIAEAWMRLHVYVWPVAYPPENYHYSGTEKYSELSTADWCFSVSLWAPVGNAIGLNLLFSGDALTKPEEELYNGVFLAGSSAGNAGMISQDQSTSGSCTWGIIGHRNINTANELRSFLSDSSLPFVFKSQNELNAQAPDVFYRSTSTILYMDPSGSEKRYSKGTDPNTSKLFVIYLTTDAVAVGVKSYVYYFGRENGF